MTPKSFGITLYIPLPSALNLREHWSKKRTRERYFEAAIVYNQIIGLTEMPLPCVITLTRLSPRLCDDDNNVGAFKKVRDVIADIIICKEKGIPYISSKGRNDSDPRITWVYAQSKCKTKGFSITYEYKPKEAV